MVALSLVVKIVYGVILWLVVFFPSAIIGAALGTRLSQGPREKLVAGAFTQVMFLVLSLIVAYLAGMEGAVSYYVDREVLVISLYSFIVFLVISVLVNHASARLVQGDEVAPISSEVLERDKAMALLSLVLLAPLGEETLFRGLAEGYLMASHEPLYITILLPALLFAIVHIGPLNRRKLLLVEVFLIGILLGYLRTMTASLIPVVVSHSAINIGSLVFRLLNSPPVASQGEYEMPAS